MSRVLKIVWHCDRCHHEWYSTEKPSRCAKCKARSWDSMPGTDSTASLELEAGNMAPAVPLEQGSRKSDSLTDEELMRQYDEVMRKWNPWAWR